MSYSGQISEFSDIIDFETSDFPLFEDSPLAPLQFSSHHQGQMAEGPAQPEARSLHEQLEAFRNKNIDEWNSEDCFDWALSICRDGYLHHTHFRIDVFKLTTGHELLEYTEADFKELVDEFHGSLFYEKINELKQIQETQSTAEPLSYTTMENMECSLDLNSSLPQSKSYQDIGCASSSFNPYFQQDSSDLNWTHSFQSQDLLNCSYDSITEDSSSHSSIFSSNEATQSSLHSQSPFDYSELDDLSNLKIQEFSPISPQLCSEPFSEDSSLTSSASSIRSAVKYGVVAKPDQASVLNSGVEQSPHWFKKIPTGGCRKNRIRSPKSWEFVLRLLQDPRTNPLLVKWEDEQEGVFRLMQKEIMSRMWGHRASLEGDDLPYESFARLLRHHYKSGILIKVTEKQMVYKFGSEVMQKIREGKKW